MFKKGFLYTHKSMLDLNIYIVSSAYNIFGGYKVEVIWVNKNDNMLDVAPETLYIKPEDVINWMSVQ